MSTVEKHVCATGRLFGDIYPATLNLKCMGTCLDDVANQQNSSALDGLFSRMSLMSILDGFQSSKISEKPFVVLAPFALQFFLPPFHRRVRPLSLAEHRILDDGGVQQQLRDVRLARTGDQELLVHALEDLDDLPVSFLYLLRVFFDGVVIPFETHDLPVSVLYLLRVFDGVVIAFIIASQIPFGYNRICVQRDFKGAGVGGRDVAQCLRTKQRGGGACQVRQEQGTLLLVVERARAEIVRSGPSRHLVVCEVN